LSDRKFPTQPAQAKGALAEAKKISLTEECPPNATVYAVSLPISFFFFFFFFFFCQEDAGKCGENRNASLSDLEEKARATTGESRANQSKRKREKNDAARVAKARCAGCRS
jgi:hypothetical protein